MLGHAGGAGLTSWKVFSQTSVARLQHLSTDVATRIATTSQLSIVSRALRSEPHMLEMLEHIEPQVRSVRWNGTPARIAKRSGRRASLPTGARRSAERGGGAGSARPDSSSTGLRPLERAGSGSGWGAAFGAGASIGCSAINLVHPANALLCTFNQNTAGLTLSHEADRDTRHAKAPPRRGPRWC